MNENIQPRYESNIPKKSDPQPQPSLKDNATRVVREQAMRSFMRNSPKAAIPLLFVAIILLIAFFYLIPFVLVGFLITLAVRSINARPNSSEIWSWFRRIGLLLLAAAAVVPVVSGIRWLVMAIPADDAVMSVLHTITSVLVLLAPYAAIGVLVGGGIRLFNKSRGERLADEASAYLAGQDFASAPAVVSVEVPTASKGRSPRRKKIVRTLIVSGIQFLTAVALSVIASVLGSTLLIEDLNVFNYIFVMVASLTIPILVISSLITLLVGLIKAVRLPNVETVAESFVHQQEIIEPSPVGAFTPAVPEVIDVEKHNKQLAVKNILNAVEAVLIDYYAPKSEFSTPKPRESDYFSREDYEFELEQIGKFDMAVRKDEVFRHIESIEVELDEDKQPNIAYVSLRTKIGTKDEDLLRYAPALKAASRAYDVLNEDFDGRAGVVMFRVDIQRQPTELEILSDRKFLLSDLMRNYPSKTEVKSPVGITASGDVYEMPASHILVAGVSGAGKGSPIQSLIYQNAMNVARGTVRLWGIDPKSAEFKAYEGTSLFHKIVFDDKDEISSLIEEYWTAMKHAQSLNSRKLPINTETPLNYLMIDEFVALMGEPEIMKNKGSNGKTTDQMLYEILSQGRSANFFVLAATQEVVASVLGRHRTNFQTKIALRLNTSTHVDIVLGEGSVAKGAISHTIIAPTEANDYKTAGIANVVSSAGELLLVRFAYVSDKDLEGLASLFSAPLSEVAQTINSYVSSQEPVSQVKTNSTHIDEIEETAGALSRGEIDVDSSFENLLAEEGITPPASNTSSVPAPPVFPQPTAQVEPVAEVGEEEEFDEVLEDLRLLFDDDNETDADEPYEEETDSEADGEATPK